VETSAFPVKIHVFDNASGDETTSVLESMSSILPNLVHIKSDEFYEIDMSMMKSIEMGRDSDYVWCFGDDDALIPGSFSYLYDSLLSNPDFVYLPFFEYYDFQKPPFAYGLDVALEVREKAGNFDFLNLMTHEHMPTAPQGAFVCKPGHYIGSEYSMNVFDKTGFAFLGAAVSSLTHQLSIQGARATSLDFPIWIKESRKPKLWRDELSEHKMMFFSLPLLYSIVANSGLWTERLDWQVKKLILNGIHTAALSLDTVLPWTKRIFQDSRFSGSYKTFMVELASQLKKDSSITVDQVADLLGSMTLNQDLNILEHTSRKQG